MLRLSAHALDERRRLPSMSVSGFRARRYTPGSQASCWRTPQSALCPLNAPASTVPIDEGCVECEILLDETTTGKKILAIEQVDRFRSADVF